VTAGELRVRRAEPGDAAARDAFVRQHERGTFFHLAGWGRVVERVMGHAVRDLLAFQDGALAGVLPLASCRGLARHNLISVPYAVYGGPLGIDASVERALFEAAEEEAVRERVGRLELRCLHDPGFALPGSELYATFIRELPGDPGEVLARMPKKSRAEARKARESGLDLSCGPWFVEDLIRLFHRNKRSLGSPGLPPALFRELLVEFGADASVHLVRKGSRPLAAVMSFRFGRTLLAYYSGTAQDADRELSASNFMYMALQEWGVRQGLEVFDFGRSRRDAGAFRFKQHQGFEPRDLHYRFRLVRDRDLPALNPSNPRTKVLRDTWRRLPLWLTTRLSSVAARYLP